MIAQQYKLRKRRAVSYSRMATIAILGVILAAVFGVLALNNIRIAQKIDQLRATHQELESREQELTTRQQELEASVTQAQTEEYQEELLREKGLYKREGEKVITVLPPESSQNNKDEENEKHWWNPFSW